MNSLRGNYNEMNKSVSFRSRLVLSYLTDYMTICIFLNKKVITRIIINYEEEENINIKIDNEEDLTNALKKIILMI